MNIYARRLNLNSANNLRELGGFMRKDGKVTKYGQFLRSDLISGLNASDIDFLKKYGLKTVIDLRAEDELLRRPNCFDSQNGSVKGFNFHWHPIFTAFKGPQELIRESLLNLYIYIFETSTAFGPLFNFMAENHEGVILYHCTSGKDRTGMVTALLLSLAGVDKADIVADYQVSHTYVKATFEENHKDIPDVPHHFAHSDPLWIETFLGRIEKEYETAENFLLQNGATPENLAIIKDKII